MQFKCGSCEQIHEGVPTFGWNFPVQYIQVPEEEREKRISLGTDDCVIDEEYFFIRGCIDIPVHGEIEPFSWGVWVSLSKENFIMWAKHFEVKERAHIGPFFGWLSSDIWLYPQTLNLKASVHIRDNGIRPYIELEPTDHPLALEQKNGITTHRMEEIYEKMMHPDKYLDLYLKS